MFESVLLKIVLPLAVDAVKSYVNNSESKKDDKILEMTQIGATYLAKKGNNNVRAIIADELNNSSMRTYQKAK